MSERPAHLHPNTDQHPHRLPDLLRQADALVAWVLLGWLGQRLGWSVASGVLPVVVWWALRCSSATWPAWTAWTAGMRLPLARVWPMVAAVALLSSLAWLPTSQGALLVLLLSAAMWGVWSASLSAAARSSDPTLPGQAMGLMMGSLWLSGQWCLGPIWTEVQAVALHLGLMIGVPLLMFGWRHLGPSGRSERSGRAQRMKHLAASVRLGHSLRTLDIHTALLAAGALLMAWPGASSTGRIAGMVLLVLAWTLSSWHTTAADADANAAPHFLPLPAAVGPALLLAVGLGAPTQGPVAMQSAWWIIATLALASLVRWRPGTNRPEPPTQRWSDIS